MSPLAARLVRNDSAVACFSASVDSASTRIGTGDLEFLESDSPSFSARLAYPFGSLSFLQCVAVDHVQRLQDARLASIARRRRR